MISVVKVVHGQLQVHHVGLLEMHSVPGGEAAAHCKITLDHPWHPGRGNPGRERGRRVEKRRGREKTEEKSKEGEGRGTGGGRGKREGGDMRESVRPVQRWSALSYRAGDYRRCSVSRIHRLWCQQGQRIAADEGLWETGDGECGERGRVRRWGGDGGEVALRSAEPLWLSKPGAKRCQRQGRRRAGAVWE